MSLNVKHSSTMHASTRKALFLALSAATIFATGCRKKPNRPDPSATVIGQPGVLDPNATSGFDNGLNNNGQTEAGSALTNRDGVIDDGKTIRGLLQPVYFSYDQSAIVAHERTKLDAAKAHLDAHPEQRLLIEGRCDWRGTAEYNLGLGDRRAAAAKQYLVTLGVPATKIETLSKGDLEATENASEDVMSKDRRAELVILKQ